MHVNICSAEPMSPRLETQRELRGILSLRGTRARVSQSGALHSVFPALIELNWEKMVSLWVFSVETQRRSEQELF